MGCKLIPEDCIDYIARGNLPVDYNSFLASKKQLPRILNLGIETYLVVWFVFSWVTSFSLLLYNRSIVLKQQKQFGLTHFAFFSPPLRTA